MAKAKAKYTANDKRAYYTGKALKQSQVTIYGGMTKRQKNSFVSGIKSIDSVKSKKKGDK